MIKGDTTLRNNINANAWIYGPGLPTNCPVIKSVELEKAGKAANDFLASNSTKSIDTLNWTTHHWMYFLRSMKGKLDVTKMETLDNAYGFSNSGNSEIQSEWYIAAVANKYTKAYPNLEQFLLSVGRRKFVKPLFTELAKTSEGLTLAKKIYEKARPGYHAVTVQTVDGILKW